MHGWTTRSVDAPAADLLALAEVAKLLGLGEKTLRRLIADGEFPDGVTVGRQGKVWDWQSVAFYRLRLLMANRLAPRPAAPAAAGAAGGEG